MADFNSSEALVLNYIQRSVPMARCPFAVIGADLGIRETVVIQIISELKNRRIIRNIAAIFNPQSLGYAMGLVGLEVPESCIDKAAAAINAHPGVSHNYLRNNRYNIWFTLAEETEAWFCRSVDSLARAAGASDSLALKTERVFKIGVRLPVSEERPMGRFVSQTVSCRTPKTEGLTLKEKTAIGLLQRDLPIVERPFQKLAAISNNLISEDRLLELGKSLEDRGIMRRYAAVLRHMNAGFTHNAMTVWKLPDNETSLAGIDAFIRESAVSHLYRRTIHPGKWEYPLFAMIHAKSNSDLTDVIRRLSQESGIEDYQVLRSLREFKKQRVVYFSVNFRKWHKKLN
jgi:DNA-binding Lrp family transcriptional regulator